jgi:hypothetical protein
MDGWVGGWMGGKAGLRIAYSNQKKKGNRCIMKELKTSFHGIKQNKPEELVELFLNGKNVFICIELLFT